MRLVCLDIYITRGYLPFAAIEKLADTLVVEAFILALEEMFHNENNLIIFVDVIITQ